MLARLIHARRSGDGAMMGEEVRPVVDELVDGDGRQFTFYRWSEVDDITLRIFAVLNATYYLREAGLAVPHQWRAIMQALHRAPAGARPPEERLPGGEYLDAEAAAALCLSPAGQSVVARWPELWDRQPEQERWALVARCAARYLLDNNLYGVPAALRHLTS